MTAASAPGKVILLGEHAVVFGRPAIALAIDLRLRCEVAPSTAMTVNGHIMEGAGDPYIATAVKENWKGGPLAIDISSTVPPGSGLGSSAAVTVATLGALAAAEGDIDPQAVARRAFDVESLVQGRASPIDTSVSSHGGGIFISSERGENLLWEMARDTRRWFIHDCEVPEMTLVVGFTGRKAPTGPLVAKVRRYHDRSGFAREIIDEIGGLTIDGLARLRAGDVEALGRLMTRDHNLLAILGVSTPELQKLVDAALPFSYGAKLTGAGGGGSMIALTDAPEKVARAIRARGGTPYIVRTGVAGVKKEED
ncbi:MAG: mevalonate kinase [Methanomassiliicoccus sp.]|nr:mevalonate kinase [Methanomassiliicoccus sp.]